MESLDAAALRHDFNREYARESARLEALGYGLYTAAEVTCIRESLGLSQAMLARMMGVSFTAVKRWEGGERAISDANAASLERLVDRADREVDQAVKMLKAAETHDRTFIVYRDERHLRAHHPNTDLTAPWIRMIAARVRTEVGCTIEYAA